MKFRNRKDILFQLLDFCLIVFFMGIFLFVCSCSTIRPNKGVYTQVDGKDHFLFLKEKGNFRYIHYRLNNDNSYTTKGNLQQVSNKVFITHNETIQSILVDSTLKKVAINKDLRKEIQKKIKTDTLFLSKDYKSFIYDKSKFKITK